MNRRHWKEARAFAVAWLPALLTGCIPGPATTKSEMRSIERFTYDAPAINHTISAIRGGTPGAPRLIYVHGTPGDANAFADDIADPLPGFEVISIDRPGFGRTRPTDGSKQRALPAFEDQAKALEPLLVEQAGRLPILVGHSLGGPIIARAAADYPDRVAGLVILAGSLDPDLEKPRWFNHAADTWLVAPLIGKAMRTSNAEILAAPEETQELDGLLDRVTCPVLIIHGTEDGLVPVENVDYMQRQFAHIDDVETVILRGEGHFIPWRQRKLINTKIAEMVERLRSDDPATQAVSSPSGTPDPATR